MSQPLPQSGIGERIAYYRKLNGWSAERLAQEAGEGVTRAILAQLEAGRRESLSVQQLMAICFALGVPPAALLADVLHPARMVDRPRSMGGGGQVAIGRLQMWAAGRLNGPEDYPTDLPSAQKWRRLSDLLLQQYTNYESGRGYWSLLDRMKAEPAVLEQFAQNLVEGERRALAQLREEGVVFEEPEDD